MFDITRRSATRLTRLATPAERIPYVSAPADAWQRLDRWLAQLDAPDDDAAVRACLAEDGPRTVRRIVEVSSLGRASSNVPAIRALALAASLGNAATREMALEAVPEVARSVAEYLAFARAVTAD
jgi:60 kDa SS-A/Ro ribonucleoprotein